ncbi:MAG TPA: 3'-5' exonuclease [Elusimicrobiales bacterium]|nr:3'-5' exonuclease [Elusimicrobiales bacterium]
MNHSALSRSLDEAVFTFLDVETTGLSPRTSRVCEVALVAFQSGCRVSHFSSLLNPGVAIPPETTRIHGITDAMVAGSPGFAAVAPRLLSMLEGSVIVAHNAEFDLSFMEMEFSRAGLKLPVLPVIDTLHVARHIGGFSNHRLGTIAKELAISAENWHRALSDVEMTRKIFEHFMVILKKDGAATVGDVLKKVPALKNRR